MWALVIDDEEVQRDEYVAPLIEELKRVSEQRLWDAARIEQVDPVFAPACHHRAYTMYGRRCATMSCNNYIMKHPEEERDG